MYERICPLPLPPSVYLTPQEYADFVLKDTVTANALHVRLDAKLRSKPVLAGLRARAICFVQLHQPLRNVVKSNEMGQGKMPSQAAMGPVWRRVCEVATRIETSPDLDWLMDPAFSMFDDQLASEAQTR